MNSSQLKQFKVESAQEDNDLDHIFYKVDDTDIVEAESKLGITLPTQLKEFYRKVGYGFFHRGRGVVNRLLSPLQVAQINLREDFYESDPDLDVYFEMNEQDKILFFEANEGLYLTIDTRGEQNAIYLFNKEVAHSFGDFISKLLVSPDMQF